MHEMTHCSQGRLNSHLTVSGGKAIIRKVASCSSGLLHYIHYIDSICSLFPVCLSLLASCFFTRPFFKDSNGNRIDSNGGYGITTNFDGKKITKLEGDDEEGTVNNMRRTPTQQKSSY